MITGLYSATSGMIAHIEHQDIIAHNLANAQVNGFRKQRMVFRSFPDILLQKQMPDPPKGTEEGREHLLTSKVGTGSGINWAYVDFSTGRIQQTGKEGDLALLGDGFFRVQTDNGVRFTRNGTFYTDPRDGLLKTVDGGHPLLSQRGTPINVGDQPFTVGRDGTVMQNGVRTGQIGVVDFRNRDLLAPEGASLFKFDGQDITQEQYVPDNLQIEQGSLESANSDPLLEMVYLTDSYRSYEAGQKALASIDKTVETLISRVGTL